MSLKTSDLKHKIEVQVFGDSENEAGESIKTWKIYKRLWADKKQLKGITTYYEDKEGLEYTYRFKVRYREDLTEDMRIVYKGVIYDIKHINPIKELRLYETHIDCIVHKEGAYSE